MSGRPLPHPLANLFPLLHGPELAALAEDIGTSGLQHPIILLDGKVLDGRNRLAACRLAGVEPKFEKFDGTEDEALALVLSLNLTRRHLSTAQKATLAVKLLPVEQEAARRRMLAGTASGDPTQTLAGGGGGGAPLNGEANALAGKRVGVSKETVRKATKIAADFPLVFEAMEDGTLRTMGEADKLTKLDAARRAEVLAAMRRDGLRLRDAGLSNLYRVTGEVEWWTPAEVLDAARIALGGDFDLDPASCAEANANVRADRFFCIHEDGLRRHWTADRVWLNPPYGTVGPRGSESRQGVWVRKLLEEHAAKRTRQAIALVRAAPCQPWFEPLWRHPLVFIRRRLAFLPGPGVSGQAVAHSVVAGVGVNPERFASVWADWGQVVLPGPRSARSTSIQMDT